MKVISGKFNKGTSFVGRQFMLWWNSN